ncbi:hypothetical protein GB937_006707 [Aspergillus fischeri]|nr:hypothetical protein GB937_006707 [Aspergillus fischeri]
MAKDWTELETTHPSPLPPWRHEPIAEIEIGSDRETAIERAEAARSTSGIIVYSDASGREGHLSAAVMALDNNLQVVELKQVQEKPVADSSSGAHWHLLLYQRGVQGRPSTLSTYVKASGFRDNDQCVCGAQEQSPMCWWTVQI